MEDTISAATGGVERLTVSVALATFNGATFLRQQLESLAAQAHLPLEVVINDDASMDETEAVVRAFAATAPFPVDFRRNARTLGFRHNFMAAAHRCRGDLIAFCDQDDVWYPEKLARAVAAFTDGDILLWHHNARVVDRDGRALGVMDSPDRPAVSPPLSQPPWQGANGFTQVFRRDLLAFDAAWQRSLDFYDEGCLSSHDRWFFFLAHVTGTIAYDPAILADYRQHGRNVFGHSGKVRPTLAARIGYWTQDRSHVYAVLAQVAARNGEILAALAEDTGRPPAWRASVREGAGRYTALAALYQLRRRLYADGFAGRISAGAELLRRHAYSEQGLWTFGGKGLVKDAALGAALGGVMRRRGGEAPMLTRSMDMTCRPGNAN